MNFIICEAVQSDREAIINCFERSIRGSCTDDYNSRQIDVWLTGAKDNERWIEALDNQYFIVITKSEDDGCNGNEKLILGFASITSGGLIDFLFVIPEFQNRGLAKSLLDSLVNHALADGLKEVKTYSSITALPFFQRQKFVVQRENVVERKGVFLKNYLLSKQL